MNPIEHFQAILRREIGPETGEWLRNGVLRAIAGDMPLERCLGVHGRLGKAYVVAMRDENLAEGAARAGSVEKYLQAYRAWKANEPFEDEGALIPLIVMLDIMEEHGVKLPKARHARTVVARLVK